MMGGSSSKGQEKYRCVQLHNAIVGGNETAARELLICGAVSPNNKLFTHSRKLVLPLFTAVENNCLSLVEVLLQYDASTSTFNREGLTPLHLAVSQNLLDVAETLIRHQADPSSVNAQGDTALHVAATYGLVNMALLLLRSGASVNSAGKLQRTPLHSACAIPGNLNMITTLLNNGADPDALDEEHRAPLLYLGQLGNMQGIDCLIQAGAQKNTCDLHRKTALHVTVENEEVAATRSLIRHQCDINWQDSNGQTPLHKAVEKEYCELVTILLQNGADANLPNSSGVLPLRTAVWKKNVDITQKLLLNGGAEVNACDKTGITPLHVACLYALKNNENDKTLVELLLNSGADVNIRCTKHGRSPLHNAVEAKNDETVMLLIRGGADTSMVDSKGRTPQSLSTDSNITALLSDNSLYHIGNFSNGLNRTPTTGRIDLSTNHTTPARPTNLYTPPTSRSNQQGRLIDGINHAPPIPPRDGSFNHSADLLGPVASSSMNVVRHNFVWSSLKDGGNSSSNSNQTVNNKTIDLPCPSKLLSFPTTFGAGKNSPQILCYSISKSAQLIDTKVGCLLTVEYASVLSNILLYVEALNYSPDILPLPTSHRLCSNLVHFYTHYITGSNQQILINGQEARPEKEVPHFEKSVVVKFPLRKSLVELYDETEQDIKIYVSYDEGFTWEEAGSQLEKIYMDNNTSDPDTVYFATTETDELGLYAVVLCSRQDVKNIKPGDEKITSSVDPSINASVDLSQDEKCTVELVAENVVQDTLHKLQADDFPYVVSCSRLVSISFKSRDDSLQAKQLVTIHVPCTLPANTNHGELSYRVLKKCEELNATGWWSGNEQEWSDVTEKECQHLQTSSKGRRLLGANQSASPQHISFTIILNSSSRSSLLIVAVRTFSSSLSSHLASLPKEIDKLQTSSNICFMVHQKSNKLSHITCDAVADAQAKGVSKMYETSGLYKGTLPSVAQLVQERDVLVISAVGGVKMGIGEGSRKVVFHSCLLPFSEHFNIKGATCSYNTNEEYIGYIEITKDPKSADDKFKPRSALNSESSVLVMENNSAMDRTHSSTSSAQQSSKMLLASLPVELPRKSKHKVTKPSPSAAPVEKELLNDKLLQQICKDLDKPELRELAFQLDISKQKVDEFFLRFLDRSDQAGVAMLHEWSREKIAGNHDPVPLFCDALRCIGRETLSQDVAQRCNPFVLEELRNLAPLPVLTEDGSVELPPQASEASSDEPPIPSRDPITRLPTGLFSIPE
ncbi:unnamed protein product [Clavelina lepadiformis]|uniref:Uncharacterized protein n=1 Tax=Clavelina lepadiformis TaxID=159417 RepID=A0ABP0GMM7_CLALP